MNHDGDWPYPQKQEYTLGKYICNAYKDTKSWHGDAYHIADPLWGNLLLPDGFRS